MIKSSRDNIGCVNNKLCKTFPDFAIKVLCFLTTTNLTFKFQLMVHEKLSWRNCKCPVDLWPPGQIVLKKFHPSKNPESHGLRLTSFQEDWYPVNFSRFSYHFIYELVLKYLSTDNCYGFSLNTVLKPANVKRRISQRNQPNTMPAGALAPQVTRSSPAILLTVKLSTFFSHI